MASTKSGLASCESDVFFRETLTVLLVLVPSDVGLKSAVMYEALIEYAPSANESIVVCVGAVELTGNVLRNAEVQHVESAVSE